jgi:hypothetical protein
MTIVESFLSYRAFGKRLEKDILVGLARVIVVVMAVYFVFKIQDLARRDNLHLVFQVTRESVLFWGEMGLGVILPMILLFIRRVRRSQVGLFFSSILVVMGFIINRLNVSITGMLHSETYFPKWTELAITVGLVVFGFVVFTLAVKHLAIFPKGELPEAPEKVKPIFTGNLVLIMWCLFIFGSVTYALTKRDNGVDKPMADFDRSITVVADELELPEDIEYVECNEANDCPGPVIFSHESHVYLQDEPDCAGCHSGMFSMNSEGRSNPVRLTMESMYAGEYVGIAPELL